MHHLFGSHFSLKTYTPLSAVQDHICLSLSSELYPAPPSKPLPPTTPFPATSVWHRQAPPRLPLFSSPSRIPETEFPVAPFSRNPFPHASPFPASLVRLRQASPQHQPSPSSSDKHLHCNDGSLVEKVMKSLRSSGLLCAAGIATSMTNSGQQWDFPNGWAPLQHVIVEGLVRSGSKEAMSMAEDIAVRWIRTNYAASKKTGTMHEKYDVEECGKVGGGGEYGAQTGFGWSNGVLLAFLEEFGWPQDRKLDSCQWARKLKT